MCHCNKTTRSAPEFISSFLPSSRPCVSIHRSTVIEELTARRWRTVRRWIRNQAILDKRNPAGTRTAPGRVSVSHRGLFYSHKRPSEGGGTRGGATPRSQGRRSRGFSGQYTSNGPFSCNQIMDDRWESEVIEYGAINITGFRIVDTTRPYVKDFLAGWHRRDPATSQGAGRESISVRMTLVHAFPHEISRQNLPPSYRKIFSAKLSAASAGAAPSSPRTSPAESSSLLFEIRREDITRAAPPLPPLFLPSITFLCLG